ncbi:MAG: hypothetical protein MUP85_07410 [Candidatus Lokiarchaeota archaeon]|nr:hypothetical protein [Candidatus Lokiarchaeota archaeon]
MKKENWQKVLIIVAVLTFLFGSGIIFRLCSNEDRKSNISSEKNDLPNSNNFNREFVKSNIPYSSVIQLGEMKIFELNGEEVKINFKELSKSSKSKFSNSDSVDAVVLSFDIGGGLVYGGNLTTEVGVNEFLMPESKDYEQELYSAYHFTASENYFNFFRIYVEHINKYNKTVKLNLYFSKKSF